MYVTKKNDRREIENFDFNGMKLKTRGDDRKSDRWPVWEAKDCNNFCFSSVHVALREKNHRDNDERHFSRTGTWFVGTIYI